MDKVDEKSLSERDICTGFITPAVKQAGWDELSQIREEVGFTKGRIIVRGKLLTRGKAKRADYILYYKPNLPIALIEKDNSYPVGGGMQQVWSMPRPWIFPSSFRPTATRFFFTIAPAAQHARNGVDPRCLSDTRPCPQARCFHQVRQASRAVLEALLQKYQDEGVTDLDNPQILKISPFDAMARRSSCPRPSADGPALDRPCVIYKLRCIKEQLSNTHADTNKKASLDQVQKRQANYESLSYAPPRVL